MASTALAGTASITADGKQYNLVGECSYDPSTAKREPLMGQDGLHGFKEMPKPGFIEATIRDAGNLSMADFNAMTNVTVVLQLANGKMVIGRNMFTTDPESVATEEGTMKVKWAGIVTEQTA